MKDSTLISNVVGFDCDVNIIDQNGEYIATGVKTILPETEDEPSIGNRIGGESWFTNFNEGLLSKIRNCKRINN
jgi:hypothetical protein